MRIRKDLKYYRKDENSTQGYRYEGEYFNAPVEANRLQGIKRLLMIAAFVQAALVFLIGWLDFPSLRVMYVILPYLGLIYAAGRCLWAAGHLFTWENRMTIRQSQISWKALQENCVISAIAMAFLSAAVCIFLLWGNGSIVEEWKLLILCVIHPLIALCMHFVLK